MLKFAALRSTQDGSHATDPAMAAAAQLSAPPKPASAPAPIVAAADEGAAPQAADTSASTAVVEQAAPVPVDPPVLMTSVEPDPVDAAAAVPARPAAQAHSGAALININKASADVLDRFPGAGHIGHAIVSHRPYRAIGDLVKKRVLTTGDFRKIQGRISVD